MRDGTLESIFRRWGIWNDDQPKLYARMLGNVAPAAGAASPAAPGAPEQTAAQGRPDAADAVRRYLPALVRAALITIVLSCLAMALP
jgi:hypothetical protein